MSEKERPQLIIDYEANTDRQLIRDRAFHAPHRYPGC